MRRRWALAVALVLAAARGGTADAQGTDAGHAFYQAVELEESGRLSEAVKALVDLATRAPGDPLADDALAEAARILEEKLLDPRQAALHYERIVNDYPSSRLALRAKRRAEALRNAMGPGGRDAAVVAEFQEILIGFSSRPVAESIARMERLLGEHPGFAEAPRGLYWLGHRYREAGRHDDAAVQFRRVEAAQPRSEWALLARKARGDMLVDQGDLDGAERVYLSISELADPGSVETAKVVDGAMQRLGWERWRKRADLAAWTILGLFLLGCGAVTWREAGSLRDAALALARPPVEVLYLLPVALLFVGAALTEHQSIGRSVAFICAAALVTCWLSGVAMDTTRNRRERLGILRGACHALATSFAIAAACYLAVTVDRLDEQLIETVRFGAQH
ncbi:MAG: tetratricopeptide repeat protein [Deltaproteobacteria bacterium]|nr:tetratricopeptide repeat protein [Deltaproteobacteria bacterium]